MRTEVSPRNSFPIYMGLSARRLGCMLGLMIVVSLTALASSASADVSFCPAGTGPGQCKEPSGLAVDPATGNLYVADRANNRIDVFDSTASFLFAFGWGVADGSSAEPQTCTATCFRGLAGGGAGEFEKPESIAVDPAAPHDVYVSEQSRVQRFSSSGEFIATWGGGVISGGASGKGDLSSGSSTVTNVVTTKKAFALGQGISGLGIPAGTKIVALGEGTITLSKAATATGAGVALSVAEGAGNVPVNETQVLTIKQAGISFPIGYIRFFTSDPSPSEAEAEFNRLDPPPASGPGGLQGALEALPNIGTGNVSVTGATGGPYTIEFKGPRFADTDVSPLSYRGAGNVSVVTTRNGAGAAETCTAANAVNCSAGIEGTGHGQFAKEPRVAVGPGGTIYVSDCVESDEGNCKSRVQKFEPSGAFSEELVLPGTNRIRDLAVDSSGDLYIGRTATGVEKVDPSGNPLFTLNLTAVQAVAVDSSDNLFVSHYDGNSKVVTEFDSSGAILSRFGYDAIDEGLAAIAVNSTPTGDVFGSERFNDRLRYLSLPAPGPLPCCVQAELGNTKATLKGGVNPEGKAATYHFDYITEADFKANGNSFTGPKPFASTPESASVSSDFSLYAAEAVIGCADPGDPPQASCLKPATPYRYRLVAKTEDGENATAEAQFETKPPFEVLETYATDVGTDAASLHATVNPLGILATAYFEYVDDAAYQADKGEGHDGFSAAVRVPDVDGGKNPIDLGSGEVPKALGAELSSLAPGTLYHYRVVVTDSFVTDSGPERTFTTFLPPRALGNPCPNAAFRGGPSATLPDCRAYEMVSPVEKNGNDIRVLGNGPSYPARLDQSSTDGNRFTYSSGTSFGDAKSAPWSSQYLASRTATGWSNHSINTPRETPSLAGAGTKFDVPYKFFSPELDNGWVYQDANPPLNDCGTEGFTNIYRRDNATGEYEALLSNKPLAAITGEGRIELQGVSADGTKSVFRADVKLTKDAAASGYQLYEHVKGEGCGELRLVNILPSGKASPKNASAGTPSGLAGEYRENTVARAVSTDASRIVFTLSALGPGPLYLRVNADQDQSVVSAGKCTEAQKGCTLEISPDEAQFWTASVDGSTVVYSVGAELFEFDVSKALAGETARTLIASQAKGVVGASEDGSRIYLVSSEELGGSGIAGKPNLYSYEPGKNGAERFGLVATLSAEDLEAFGNFGFSLANPRPIANGVRLTRDAGHLAFVSTASLTGYDNADATDGRPALELYLYDLDSGKLACVSCNPSGGRPHGRLFFRSVARRVSAQMPPGESQTFAPRALSEDGNRLFFESFEALLPGDTNGKADVYGWQRASGAKQCEEAGAELYVPSAGGCLSLISTGLSPIDSELADASPDGHDVFIRTASSLLPQDPGLVDIYDARINGGFPQPPGLPAACEGEACQGPASPPNDPTPASSSFRGAGNVKKAPARCRKPKIRRKGRCVAKKSHRHHKHSQTNHKRRAGR